MRIKKLIKTALKEDIGPGDVTTDAIFGTDSPQQQATIVAKQSGIICGIDFFCDTMHSVDPDIQIDVHLSNGSTVKAGDVIMTLHGPIASLLKGERTALNFLAKFSGIATLTRQYVDQIQHTNAVLLDTRKTTPAYRHLEKFAVRIGGGSNHRIGLYDMVMIKDNHIDACGSITKAVKRVRGYLRQKETPDIPIEVEVRNEEQLREALELDIDRIMLDNMTPAQITSCVRITNGKTPLEVSGNVDLETIREYAETGVDFISVGKLTHSAPAFDFSMRMKS